ncbi:hypothetical protein ACTZNP_24385, partial [Klebsiella pneumoniae]
KKLINVAFSEGCFLNVVFRMVGPQTPLSFSEKKKRWSAEVKAGGPYNSSCSASDKIWTRSSNAMDLAQKD